MSQDLPAAEVDVKVWYPRCMIGTDCDLAAGPRPRVIDGTCDYWALKVSDLEPHSSLHHMVITEKSKFFIACKDCAPTIGYLAAITLDQFKNKPADMSIPPKP